MSGTWREVARRTGQRCIWIVRERQEWAVGGVGLKDGAPTRTQGSKFARVAIALIWPPIRPATRRAEMDDVKMRGQDDAPSPRPEFQAKIYIIEIDRKVHLIHATDIPIRFSSDQ